jgi:hypothetical protein
MNVRLLFMDNHRFRAFQKAMESKPLLSLPASKCVAEKDG